MKRIALAARPAIVVFLVFLSFAQSARASELSAFNTAVAEAYGYYRQATFYLRRSANPDVAALELESFIEKWQAVLDRFAKSPPDAFSGDLQWEATLQEVASRAENTLAALDKGDPEAAQKEILPIRGLLGDLRRRNGVVVYSDVIDALSAEMATFIEFRRNPPDFDDAARIDAMLRQAAVVNYLFDQCEVRASAELRADPQFKRQIDGARVSMEKVWKAVETKDRRLLRIGIGEALSFERILFLQFG